MSIESVEEQRKRFANVMAARRGDASLLDLFDKLLVSQHFSDDAKPYCFGDLIKEAARRIDEVNVPALQQVVERLQVPTLIREYFVAEEAELIGSWFSGLVGKLFSVTPRQPEPLVALFKWFERVGISPLERVQTVGYALEAGMPESDLDVICDLTMFAYYGDTRELAMAA